MIISKYNQKILENINHSPKRILSLIPAGMSVALVFVLSGCMEDNNSLNYFAAAAAGATVATAVGYFLIPTKSEVAVIRIQSYKN